MHKLLKTLAIFGQINCIRAGSKDRNALVLQGIGQLQRGLPAKLYDDTVQRAVFLFDPQNFHDMFECQRFKIQPVRRVVICRYGFRVAIDHDGFVTGVRQRITGVTAAIIKLDPLPDPVWTAAQNDHFLAVAWAGFAFHLAHHRGLVGGIHIGRLGLEFGGTGINAFEHGIHANVAAGAANVGLCLAGQFGETGISKA